MGGIEKLEGVSVKKEEQERTCKGGRERRGAIWEGKREVLRNWKVQGRRKWTKREVNMREGYGRDVRNGGKHGWVQGD